MTGNNYDAGNRAHVKKAKHTQKILENRFRNGILKICNDDEIRYVMAQFFDVCGPFRDHYATDSRDHARNAGWAGAGLWFLQNLLLHDPEIVRKLQEDEDSPLKVKDDDGTDPDPDD